MAKNLGREFAMMTEDERRRFMLDERRERSDAPDELNFDDPRDHNRIGRSYRSLNEQGTDTDRRDGASALPDDEAYTRKVERSRGSTGGQRSMELNFATQSPLWGWNYTPDQSTRGNRTNVGKGERLLSGLVGVVVAVAALRRPNLRRMLLPLAGGLLWRAITGRSTVNRAIGRNSAVRKTVSPVASVRQGAGIKVERRMFIDRPQEELYQFWRNFENLPRFMSHLESVTILDENRSAWIARGPLGSHVEWTAEIHNEIPNELIAWRTLPGSEVNHAGSVHFEPRSTGQGTTVRVILRYEPPAGKPGAMIASLFGEEPSQQIADDLRRFKAVMEASEPITTGRMRGMRMPS